MMKSMILLSASGAAAIKTKHLEEEVNNKNSAFLQEFGEKLDGTVKTHKRGAYNSVMKVTFVLRSHENALQIDTKIRFENQICFAVR